MNLASAPSVTDLHTSGFAVLPDILGDSTVYKLCEEFIALPQSSSARERNGSTYAVRNLLRDHPAVRHLADSTEIRSLIEPVLGANALPVRGILFRQNSGSQLESPLAPGPLDRRPRTPRHSQLRPMVDQVRRPPRPAAARDSGKYARHSPAPGRLRTSQWPPSRPARLSCTWHTKSRCHHKPSPQHSVSPLHCAAWRSRPHAPPNFARLFTSRLTQSSPGCTH